MEGDDCMGTVLSQMKFINIITILLVSEVNHAGPLEHVPGFMHRDLANL